VIKNPETWTGGEEDVLEIGEGVGTVIGSAFEAEPDDDAVLETEEPKEADVPIVDVRWKAGRSFHP
jgi:hypothetical protein